MGCPCVPVALFDTIGFCPGDVVTINGVDYSQPGIVFDTLPSDSGCDTLVTYTLQYLNTSPSNLSVTCPSDITAEVPFGVASAAVTYSNPAALSDCPCGDVAMNLTQGLPSGANFPVGTTQVCHQASDECGASFSCCFTVTVEQEPADDQPCDIKNTSCLKFEILGIFQNPAQQKTYRMRMTNYCADKMVYVAFQLPQGVVAKKPADNSTYTAPSGRKYEVRNPNAAPTHSIRFKTIGNGIANGQADVFEYTLPPYADPTYIYAIARLAPQVFYETHLDVFGCTVQQTANKPGVDHRATSGEQARLSVFPNPAADVLYVNLTDWEGQQVRLQVFDALGRLALEQSGNGGMEKHPLDISGIGSDGLYTLVAMDENGEWATKRFVLKRL